MSEKINIEFIPCLIKNLFVSENCLLVFDDSCEEIYQEQAFVELAVGGRHRKLNRIFTKHFPSEQVVAYDRFKQNTCYFIQITARLTAR